ncbi:MAG: glycoside-pentoside-hexuronide (GPH):cation symporter [Clostridia bacterium]|nr:glycoside-pentoside-hexuronide (GPH):cation symporter [Clostridia bacterium]
MKKNHNRYTFGLGTVGRDMLYSMVSMFLLVYLTEVLNVSNSVLGWITAIMVGARIFDALNDPVMGVIVDNTRTRWGKFKPWIVSGAIASGLLTILLFTDFGLEGMAYVPLFGILYVLWGIAWTVNDISYWSMLPSLSMNQKEREKIGAFSRICANIGLFTLVVGIIPLTNMLGEVTGSMKKAFFIFAIAIVVIMLAGQSITVFGVKEKKGVFKQEEKTTLKGMVKAIFKNDQLLFTAIAMILFMIGYGTTTGFGVYYFKYAFGNEDMFAIFAAILGVAQITALVIFPMLSKRFNRKKIYTGASILVLLGYVVFFFSPMNMVFIGIAGILLFVGQAFIQLLMLMFLADTVEYGQWKLGKRNESVTFALQPFIYKLSGAIAGGIVGITLIISGINEAETVNDVTAGGITILKMAMFILPLAFILIGYMVYRIKYKIDEAAYKKILRDLEERGDIHLNQGAMDADN